MRDSDKPAIRIVLKEYRQLVEQELNDIWDQRMLAKLNKPVVGLHK